MLTNGSQTHQVFSLMVGEKMKPYFLQLVFWLVKSLGIVGSQIEIERIFSLMGILTNLRRYRLQSENSEHLASDLRDGCKPPSNLV
jgi:hypothetical protein